MKRFELVDFLKGYAIFTIMVFHYLQFLRLPSPFDRFIFFGGTGVHLFVLLSGFGLYLSHINRPLPFLKFLKRRMSKVYLPYIIIVLLSAFVSLLIPVFENSLYALGGHLFLYKMFDERIVGSYGYQLWFISMILQFYVAFPAIVWIRSKVGDKYFLFICFAISMAWATLVWRIGKHDERVWSSFFLHYLWEFALGMVLAKTVTTQKKLPVQPNRGTLLGMGVLCCAAYCALALKGGAHGKLYNDIFALTGYSFLAIFIYRLKLGVVNRFFMFVGNISLSVYLLHILVLLAISTSFNMPNQLLAMALALACIFPISIAYQKQINTLFKKMNL